MSDPASAKTALDVEVRELTPAQSGAAAAVLGRGMRDNPTHVAALGPDPEKRERGMTRIFESLLRSFPAKGGIDGAFAAGVLVGASGWVEPGRCQPTAGEKLRLLPAILGAGGLGGAARVLVWTTGWARHDPKKPHWHLGPVGVERHMQGRGVGSALLKAFCVRMDGLGAASYLETDKAENVTFYERFGFRVTAEDRVIGARCWYMERPPGPLAP